MNKRVVVLSPMPFQVCRVKAGNSFMPFTSDGFVKRNPNISPNSPSSQKATKGCGLELPYVEFLGVWPKGTHTSESPELISSDSMLNWLLILASCAVAGSRYHQYRVTLKLDRGSGHAGGGPWAPATQRIQPPDEILPFQCFDLSR